MSQPLPPPPAPWPSPPPALPPTPPPAGRRARQVAILGCALAAVGALVVAVVVTTTGQDDAQEVAETYLEARFAGDYETTCELWTEESREQVLDSTGADDCGAYADKRRDLEPPEVTEVLEDLEVDVRVGDVTDDEGGYVLEDGEVRPYEGDADTVEVEWAVLRTYSGDDDDRAGRGLALLSMDGPVEAEEGSLDLIEEDGEWRVDYQGEGGFAG